jgi:hypothetical protein
MLSAETPDGYTGDAIRDAMHSCRYLGITSETIEDAFDRSPNTFMLLGWDRRTSILDFFVEHKGQVIDGRGGREILAR